MFIGDSLDGLVMRMTGTATEIKMCGTTIRLGDEMEVEYTTGERMRGCRIKGKVVELWSPEVSNGHLQARLSCGWCFHDQDRILAHTPNVEVSGGQNGEINTRDRRG
mgnify:FL=1